MNRTPNQNLFSLARAFRFLALVAAGIAAIPTLMAAPPVNDELANAIVISEPLPFNHSVSTIEATSVSDPVGCFETSHTVWYSYTPTTSGLVIVDTFGSDYDTVLEVFHGSPGDLYSYYECSDDAEGVAQSSMGLWVNAGEAIYIMAGSGNGAPGGNLIVHVNPPPTPPTVTVTVVEPVTVKPSDGSVGVRIRVESSEPITLIIASATAMQSNGRGMIIGNGFLVPWQTGTSFEIVFPPIRDLRSAREHGTGFTGGPARVLAEAHYSYGSTGFGIGQAYFDKDILLRAGAERP